MFNMICIMVICVIIIDISGFIEHLKGWISQFVFGKKFINWDLPLFGCSFCSSWWANFTYIIVTGQFSIPMMTFALILSVFTPVTYELIITIKNLLIWLISLLKK